MKKILIVDDSRFQRKRIKKAIAVLELEVFEAQDGLEAEEMFERVEPDIVLTDLLMPRRTGFELLAALRDKGYATPVVVMSADLQHTSHETCRGYGVRKILSKPFEAERLLNALVDELERGAQVA